MTDFGLGYSVDFVGEGEWDIAMSGKKKDFYNQLCEKHNDVSYNRRVRVYFYDQGLNPRCFRDFVNLEVWSSADWDAEHPAGTSLNDLARFSSNTPWPYIQSGYTHKYHEQLNGEYYPVDKLISELTPDDMTLLPRGGFYFRFVTRPAQPGKHTLKNFQQFPFTFGNYPDGNILLKCADLFHRVRFAGQKCFPQDCVGFHLFLIAIPFQGGKNRGIQPACRIFPGAFCLCFRALCCLFRCFLFILHGVNEFSERRIEAGLF